MNRRDRVFSRASRSPRTGWAFPEGCRRAQRCDPDLGCPGSVLRVSDRRTWPAGIWEQMPTDPESTSCLNSDGVQDLFARGKILLRAADDTRDLEFVGPRPRPLEHPASMNYEVRAKMAARGKVSLFPKWVIVPPFSLGLLAGVVEALLQSSRRRRCRD